jgi:hypothetical protein
MDTLIVFLLIKTLFEGERTIRQNTLLPVDRQNLLLCSMKEILYHSGSAYRIQPGMPLEKRDYCYRSDFGRTHDPFRAI